MGQVGDKALGTVHAGGGGLKVIVIPQLQPDVAVTLAIHHHALLALHWLHGGISDQIAGFGVEHLQPSVLIVKGDGVAHDAGSVQRCHLTGNKVVQIIAEVAARAPCDHIAREIAAGLVVEGANKGAVHGGEIPQLVAAIAGLEAGGAAAAYLSEAGEAFAGGGVIERFVRWLAAGVAGVQLHPVGQVVRCIGKAQGSSGICAVSLCTVLRLYNDPAVQGGFIVPCVLGKVCWAGIAGEHQPVPAHDAAVCAIRHGQTFAGGKVDHLTGAIIVVAVFVAAVHGVGFLQHQQTVLHGGVLLPLKGHDFIAVFAKQAAAPSAISVRVGPGAEPVVGLTGHGVLQKVHVLAAEGLVQHLAAAQNGAGTAGIVVTVKHPQLSVVQPGAVIKRIPVRIGGH